MCYTCTGKGIIRQYATVHGNTKYIRSVWSIPHEICQHMMCANMQYREYIVRIAQEHYGWDLLWHLKLPSCAFIYTVDLKYELTMNVEPDVLNGTIFETKSRRFHTKFMKAQCSRKDDVVYCRSNGTFISIILEYIVDVAREHYWIHCRGSTYCHMLL